MSRRHAIFPVRIERARIEPRALPMYAIPSETTAGNSISVPIPRLQTTRKGGRTRIAAGAWVLAGVAPYIGHCSSGR